MVGFDIGGTKCAVCVGFENGGELNITDKRVVPTRHGVSPYLVIDELVELAKTMTDDIPFVGISCGGPLNSGRGIILSPPNLPGWDNIEICGYLKEKYGIKSALQNDANACAVAEWKFGAGKGTKNMIFLTFGTGLGAGLILDGKLYSGTSDMAGEVGHIRLEDDGPTGYGKSGSFEGFCSGSGIAALGRKQAESMLSEGKNVSYCDSIEELKNITAKSIAEKAEEGFEDATEIYEESGRRLGQGLAILIDVLNPEKIVIGSIFQRSGKLLIPSMEEVLKKECLAISREACEIVPAALGDNIGDYAALSIGLEGEKCKNF